MIVKAFIENILENNRYKVRVPIYDKIKTSSLDSNELQIAEVSTIVNSDINLNINDVVYVEYENNDRSKPVIIGCLSNNNRSNYILNSLIVNNLAKLPKNIKIGDIEYKELSCLIGVKDNIESQIIQLNEDISTIDESLDDLNIKKDELSKNIENISNNLNEVNTNIENISINIGKEIDRNNISFYGKYNDLIEKINTLDNFIGKSNTTISAIVEDLSSRVITLRNYTPVLPSQEDNDLSEPISIDDPSRENIIANSSEFKDIIAALRKKFPAGKYWNHAPTQGNTSSNGVNNQDSYTSTPCPVHHNCGTATQTCNGYAPNGVETSWQCMGYANKCGYDVTGYDPEWSDKWKTTNDSNYLKNLKGGDIIRYKNDGHSIYVLEVKDSTIVYTDCNSDGHCVIRWDVKIDKSDIKKSFTYVRISPTDLSNSRLISKSKPTSYVN